MGGINFIGLGAFGFDLGPIAQAFGRRNTHEYRLRLDPFGQRALRGRAPRHGFAAPERPGRGGIHGVHIGS